MDDFQVVYDRNLDVLLIGLTGFLHIEEIEIEIDDSGLQMAYSIEKDSIVRVLVPRFALEWQRRTVALSLLSGRHLRVSPAKIAAAIKKIL